jgi:hypothetical protein
MVTRKHISKYPESKVVSTSDFWAWESGFESRVSHGYFSFIVQKYYVRKYVTPYEDLSWKNIWNRTMSVNGNKQWQHQQWSQKGNEFRWLSNTLGCGPRLGPIVLPIFLPHFPSYCMLLVGNQVLWKLQCKFLHFKFTRADVHYTSASFGTKPPT